MGGHRRQQQQLRLGNAVTSSRTPYNCLRERNETTGRKRQSTAVSMRKPRRNDTRAGANWALEVTPSRGMLFHPRSVPCSPSHPVHQPPVVAFLLALSPYPPPPTTTSFCLLLLFLLLLFLSLLSLSFSPYITNRRRHVEDS